MLDDDIKILFIGDIIGKPGRLTVKMLINRLIDKFKPEFIIANGENAAHGMGITPDIAEFLFDLGIDVLTTGNHIWDQKSIIPYINVHSKLLRPANYSLLTPGKGYGVFDSKLKRKIGVINLEGRVFMKGFTESPFKIAKDIIEEIHDEVDVIVVDFHAEATSEKEALALYLDGEISALLGTHTHVQTNDNTILPKGTAYITDVGMVGSKYSVIGTNKDVAIRKYLTGMPEKFVPEEKNIILNAVCVTVDKKIKSNSSIEKIYVNTD
ncbi:TIGR00282 family metallophosphoesterase [Candidatus Acidulodesulfobacterium sp. H_13]|uniref:TIGR00282 family metallophosphoesterase n=1 Tax=Candidatus Acidulodesulfobacterium sp. H_13 TaxID=3395470 RepID=UPI003AF7728C